MINNKLKKRKLLQRTQEGMSKPSSCANTVKPRSSSYRWQKVILKLPTTYWLGVQLVLTCLGLYFLIYLKTKAILCDKF